MMPDSLRQMRRARWAAQAASAAESAPTPLPSQSSLASLLWMAIAELLAHRRPAHD